MENFNAQQARQIVDSLSANEIHEVLTAIKHAAEKNETVLYIHKALESKTLDDLESRGFNVYNHSFITFKNNGPHYSISW